MIQNKHLMGKNSPDWFAPEQATASVSNDVATPEHYFSKNKMGEGDRGRQVDSPGSLLKMKHQCSEGETPNMFFDMPSLKQLKDPDFSDEFSLTFQRSQTVPEPEMEETPLMLPLSQPAVHLPPVPMLSLDGFIEMELAPILGDFAAQTSSSSKATTYLPYKLLYTTNWYGSARAEKACSFHVCHPVAVTNSARVERMCSFYSTEGTPVCAIDSRRVEKMCSFLRTTPIKAVSVFRSGLAEKLCTFLGPVPLVNVFSSSRAESMLRELPPWQEDSEEEEDIAPVIENTSGRATKKYVASAPYAPGKLAGASTSNAVEKMCSFMSSEPSKVVSVVSSGRIERSCSFMASVPSKPVSVSTSSRVEKQCSFLTSEPSKAVSVITSGCIEKQCSFQSSEPVKAVSVYTSGRAEKQCSFLTDVPSRPVSVQSSGRVEKMCSFLPSEPSKAVSVYSSRSAEQCSFAEEFDIEKFDLFAEGVMMSFPEEEDGRPAAPTPASTYQATPTPASFSSSRAERCTFRAVAQVPVSYSASRAEKASTAFATEVFHQDPEVDFAPTKAHAVCSSSRIERMTSFLTSEPVKAVSVASSGRLEKACSFYADKPSKAVSVWSSSRSERCTFLRSEPVKAVSVFSSGRAEATMRALPEWHEDAEEWSFLPVLDGTEREVDENKVFPVLGELFKEAFADCKRDLVIAIDAPLAYARSPTNSPGTEPSPEMSPEARKVKPRGLA